MNRFGIGLRMSKVAKYALLCAFIACTVFFVGCSNYKKGDELSATKSGFTVVEARGNSYCIVVDNKTGYEYFGSISYHGNTIIGGNVLDENGHPKKYVKE